MRQPPPTVQVGPATYKIRVTRLTQAYGRTKMDKARIDLDDRLADSAARDTLMHEILHAILLDAGAETLMGVDADGHEAWVRLLTPWVLSVVRDNPDVIEYLRAE